MACILFSMMYFEVELFLCMTSICLNQPIQENNFWTTGYLCIHLMHLIKFFPFVNCHLDRLLLLAAYHDALLFNTGVVLMFVKMILLLVVQVQENLSIQILNNKIDKSHLQVLWIEKQ